MATMRELINYLNGLEKRLVATWHGDQSQGLCRRELCLEDNGQVCSAREAASRLEPRLLGPPWATAIPVFVFEYWISDRDVEKRMGTYCNKSPDGVRSAGWAPLSICKEEHDDA